MLCRGKPEVAKRSTHLDLKPDPAAGAPVLINDHIEVLRHRALHAAVLHINAADGRICQLQADRRAGEGARDTRWGVRQGKAVCGLPAAAGYLIRDTPGSVMFL